MNHFVGTSLATKSNNPSILDAIKTTQTYNQINHIPNVNSIPIRRTSTPIRTASPPGRRSTVCPTLGKPGSSPIAYL
jgi:hypothetical protein